MNPKCIIDILNDDLSVSCESIDFKWITEEVIKALGGGDIWVKTLSSGSTTANRILMLFLRRSGRRKILISEFPHKSILQAAAEYGIKPVYLKAEYVEKFEAVLPPSIKTIENEITRNKDAGAVVLVSPTYDLASYRDYRKISELSHENGMLLVIDGAWEHPPNLAQIMREGVDVFINSVHKMCGALQGASIMAARMENLSPLLSSCYQVETTSPSFPILLSIGLAFKVLREEPGILDLPEKFIKILSEKLKLLGFNFLKQKDLSKEYRLEYRLDPWKIQVATNSIGYSVKKVLEERFGIVAEKSGMRHLQIIGTFRELLRCRNEKELQELAEDVANRIVLSQEYTSRLEITTLGSH
ncbi:MAG: aminotransferase class V-fold PLP-dependent enzyme [Nitrososphaerota archaeon]